MGNRWRVAIILLGIVVSGCSGGVDGPVVEGNRRSGGETAEVFGEVVIEGDCIYLYQSGNDTRYPVVWPHGTRWDTGNSAIVLPDGTPVVDGDEVYGGGGYHYPDGISEDTTAQGVVRISACVDDNDSGEIAVFNTSDRIDVLER